ncbi:hypothetical protein DFH08DRAFT_883109 [Mycena albidolilacea]|uniref:Uncharacterized protein n=1 Tax=Mycena albidolilacea TaxID=1033008 RepID=A0AAD7EJF6_9AGAR|nr:hypothetical protein DFH08DRAFT_883109 [Mycena albidolilacea]
MRPATFALFLSSLFFSLCLTVAHSVGADTEAPEETVCVYDRRSFLEKRADGDDGGDATVGVNLPSVGLSLGNITTKLGNINLTVTNVTISVGNIDIEDITIGNITIIVSVPLPGASPINAFSASSAATSIATSTSTGTSTVSPPVSVTQTASAGSFLQRLKRQDSGSSSAPATTTTPSLPTVTVGGGDVSAGAGSVDTEIGNITIFVGNVNVSVGDVKVKNVSIGNIFVLVQIGQPDINGAIGNLTNALSGIGSN